MFKKSLNRDRTLTENMYKQNELYYPSILKANKKQKAKEKEKNCCKQPTDTPRVYTLILDEKKKEEKNCSLQATRKNYSLAGCNREVI